MNERIEAVLEKLSWAMVDAVLARAEGIIGEIASGLKSQSSDLRSQSSDLKFQSGDLKSQSSAVESQTAVRVKSRRQAGGRDAGFARRTCSSCGQAKGLTAFRGGAEICSLCARRRAERAATLAEAR